MKDDVAEQWELAVFLEFLASLSVKDVIVPLIGTIAGAVGHHYAIRTQNAEKAQEAKQAAEVKEVDSFVQRERSQSDNLTQRFKLLMDGYENQITSLTTEVQGLRRQIEEIRGCYEEHRLRCAACPHFLRSGDAAH